MDKLERLLRRLPTITKARGRPMKDIKWSDIRPKVQADEPIRRARTINAAFASEEFPCVDIDAILRRKR